MSNSRILSRIVATFAMAVTLASAALAQPSDPAGFETVFNIGNVEPGSIFDITYDDIPGTLVTGDSVGDGSQFFNTSLLTPNNLAGSVLDSNSQLNLFDGGEILLGFATGSLSDTVTNAEVNIFGGIVRGEFFVSPGSTVNIFDGTLPEGFSSGRLFNSNNTSQVSTINILGGSIELGVVAFEGSELKIAGGNIGSFVQVDSGSTLDIFGDAFELNGEPTSDLSAGFGLGSSNPQLLTGILADGSVLVFASDSSSSTARFAAGTTRLQAAVAAPSSNPGILSSGLFTQGVRAGETLTVNGTGELSNNFAVVRGTLDIQAGSVGHGLSIAFGEVNITGGSVGDAFSIFSGTTVNLSGGSVGDNFDTNSGSTVNISGGSVGDSFDANSGSTVNISGGSVGDYFTAGSNSTVNISGGSVGDNFNADSNSTINISGGSIGGISGARIFNNSLLLTGGTLNYSGGNIADGFRADFGSTVNVFGTQFFLNGQELTELVLNETTTISNRSFTLTGLLADGATFSFSSDDFSTFATLTVTLVTPVPEPTTAALLVLAGTLPTRRRRA